MSAVNDCSYFTSTQDTLVSFDVHGEVHQFTVTVQHDCTLTAGHDKEAGDDGMHKCQCGGTFSNALTGQREEVV